MAHALATARTALGWPIAVATSGRSGCCHTVSPQRLPPRHWNAGRLTLWVGPVGLFTAQVASIASTHSPQSSSRCKSAVWYSSRRVASS